MVTRRLLLLAVPTVPALVLALFACTTSSSTPPAAFDSGLAPGACLAKDDCPWDANWLIDRPSCIYSANEGCTAIGKCVYQNNSSTCLDATDTRILCACHDGTPRYATSCGLPKDYVFQRVMPCPPSDASDDSADDAPDDARADTADAGPDASGE